MTGQMQFLVLTLWFAIVLAAIRLVRFFQNRRTEDHEGVSEDVNWGWFPIKEQADLAVIWCDIASYFGHVDATFDASTAKVTHRHGEYTLRFTEVTTTSVIHHISAAEIEEANMCLEWQDNHPANDIDW